MAFVVVAGYAQGWTKPSAVPEGAVLEEHLSTDEVKDTLYLYNVAGASFLGGGNDWGTHTSIKTSGDYADLPYFITYFDNPMVGYQLYSPNSKALKILGRESEAGNYIDYNNQSGWGIYWSIEAQGNGYYRIRSAEGDPVWGRDARPDNYDIEFFGWDGGDNTKIYSNIDPEAEGVGVDWVLVTPSVYRSFGPMMTLKDNLYNLYLTIEEEGLDVDYEQFTAAYEGEDVAALQAAYDALLEAITAARVAELGEGASPEDPADFTSLLVNPDFNGNINGWTCTFKSGTNATNVGYQGASYTNGDVQISQFIEAWANNSSKYNPNLSYAAIGDAELEQVVKYLPAGKYMFTVDCIAVQQYQGSENPVKGVQLFATGGDIDKYVEIHTGNGQPEHYELTFAKTEGDLTLGLRTRNTTANWIAADNFTLWYMGPVDPWQAALEEALAEFEEEYGSVEDVHAQADLKDAAQTAFEAATEAVETSGADYQAVYENLTQALDALKASMADYDRLSAVIESWNEKLAALDGTKWEDVGNDLSDAISPMETAYDDGSYTAEDINKCDSILGKVWAEGIGKLVQKGDDLTFLLNNPGFEKDFSGWTMDKGSIGFGGTPVTLEDGTEITSGVAEQWRGAFDFHQTIYNMPSGLYTLSVKAFERNENDQSLRTTSSELYAIVNGETQTVKTKNINADATDEMLFSSEMAGEGAIGTESDKENAEGKYIPNGRCGANVHFYYGGYENKFNILVDEISDIVVGMRDEKDDNWVLFDDFRIVYKGNGADAYTEAIEALIAEADAMPEKVNPDFGRVLTQEALTALSEAANHGMQVIEKDDATEEECRAVMAEIQAAIDFAEATMELTGKLYNEYTMYNDYRMLDENGQNISSGDTEFPALLDEVLAYCMGDEVFATNAEVQEYRDKLAAGYTKFVQYDYLDATEEDPADLTLVIYNPNGNGYLGENVGAEGWDITVGAAGYGSDGAAAPDGEKSFVEFYQQAFDMHQTIYGLAPGFYVLGVQGFYRDGFVARIDSCLNNIDGFVENKYAKLYAGETETYLLPISANYKDYTEMYALDEDGLKSKSGKLTIGEEVFYIPNTVASACRAFENEMYQNFLLFEVKEGQESVTIGVRKEHNGNVKADAEAGIEAVQYGDWTLVDTWTLKYLGKTAPAADPTTDIQGVDFEAPAAPVIYNLAGQRVVKAQKGIYIVSGRKVVVK